MGLVTKKDFLTCDKISSCRESRHLLLEYMRLFICKNIYFVALFVKSFFKNIEDFSMKIINRDKNAIFLSMSILNLRLS
jgi:hypothetical protein